MFYTLVNSVLGASDTDAATITKEKAEAAAGAFKVDVFQVDGTDANEILVNAMVALKPEAHAIEITGVMPAEKGGGPGSLKFDCSTISKFRQHQKDMFQWLVKKKSADSGEEYGMLCHTMSGAREFNRSILPLLRATASPLTSAPIEFRVYDRQTKEWKVVVERATLRVVQRPGDLESFLVVLDEKEHCIAQLTVSHDEYIFPQEELNQLTWWGFAVDCELPIDDTQKPEEDGDDASKEGHRHMFAARFVGGEEDAKQTFKMINVVTCEAHEGQKLKNTETMDVDEAAGYDDEAFDKSSSSGGHPASFEKEEEDDKCVITQDPTRQLLTKSADAKVHKFMQVGRDRTFVTRATRKGLAQVDVVGFEADGVHNIVASIDDKKLQYKGADIAPRSAILHDGETKMIMADEKCKDHVYLMDIENEKVVQHWETGEEKVQSLIPKFKGAGRTHEKTFVAFNPQAVFDIDTRMDATNGRKATLSYASKVQFTAGATNDEGHILLGNKFGQLRLYDGEANKEGKMKRAKTQLSGLGDPLLHVAVTKDGSWILGTCQKYLALFPVRLAETGKTGFQTALGTKKPKPLVLKLSMDDLTKFNLSDVNFTRADFDVEEDSIVSAVNNLIIIWDFKYTLS
eukprot:GHVT01068559.1.p1 GENE.GHVT01068559.1~~GHVT01068559.1.p1  ORF type:complete len:629 (+),score=121.16 GHVT01068559.1:104-1990(+)